MIMIIIIIIVFSLTSYWYDEVIYDANFIPWT